MQFFLFDPTWKMLEEYFTKNTTSHFFEKIMIFEDWNQSLPIITPERVKAKEEATFEFFSVPKERRGLTLNYTDQYEELLTNHKKMKRSIHEYA